MIYAFPRERSKESHAHSRNYLGECKMDSRHKPRWIGIGTGHGGTLVPTNRRARPWCCPTTKMLVAFLALGACGSPVLAQTCGSAVCEIDGYASTWRVENYVPNSVVLWFVDSVNCGTKGGVFFASTATDADRNRLLAVIAMAKAVAAQMFFRYNVNNGSCTVASFGFLE